ncbi:MAG TPA: hypothetical protein VKD47_04605 [Miltoncostaeaceae bacterium]|nr:hypothetical protein [Miltoncostaeaceae bacterium]
MDGRPRQRALPAALALVAVALSSAAAVAAPSAASLARADRRLGAEEAALDRSMTAHRASLLEVRQRIDSLQQGFADRAALVDGVVADLRAQSLPGVLGGLAEAAPPGREILVADRRRIARLSRAEATLLRRSSALAGRQERRGVQRALVDAGLAKARAREAAQAAARKRAEARRAAAAARAAALAPNRTGPAPPPPSYRPAPTARTIEPGLPADVIARRLLR